MPKACLTLDLLKVVANKDVKTELLQQLCDTLNLLLPLYEIDTTEERLAAFVAQIAHETDGFSAFFEQGPRNYFNQYEPGTQIGEKLGNTFAGDGYRFRGRGLIHLTGRWNYVYFTKRIQIMYPGLSLLEVPDVAANLDVACLIACEYWKFHKINKKVDAGNFQQVTKAINEGQKHQSRRINLYEKLLESLKSFPPTGKPAPEQPQRKTPEVKVEVLPKLDSKKEQMDVKPASSHQKLLSTELTPLLITPGSESPINDVVKKSIYQWQSGFSQLGGLTNVVKSAVEETTALTQYQTIQQKQISAHEIDHIIIGKIFSKPEAIAAASATDQQQLSQQIQTVLAQHTDQMQKLVHQIGKPEHPLSEHLQQWVTHLNQAREGLANIGEWAKQIIQTPRKQEEKEVKSSIDDIKRVGQTSIKTILSVNQTLRMITALPLPSGLKEVIEKTQAITTVAAEAAPLVTGLIDGIIKSTAGFDKLKVNVDDNLIHLQQDPRNEQTVLNARLKGIAQSGQLLGSLVGLANPKLGQQINQVVSYGVKSVGLISKLATGTLTGGSIGAALEVCGVLKGLFGGGPSTEEFIQQCIEKLSAHMDQRFDQLESLLGEMDKRTQLRFDQLEKLLNQRFDRLEMVLGTFYKQIMLEFKSVHKHLGEIHSQLERINGQLEQMHNQLDSIEARIDRGFRLLRIEEFENLKREVKDLERYDSHKEADYRRIKAMEYASKLHGWSIIQAKGEALAGRFTNEDTEVIESKELDKIKSTQDILEKINLLACYARRHFEITINQPLINPLVWQSIVRSYIYLIEHAPELNLQQIKFKEDLEDMALAGKAFNKFIGTLKTNRELFPKLLANYRQAVLEVLCQSYEIVLPESVPGSHPLFGKPELLLQRVRELESGPEIFSHLTQGVSDKYPFTLEHTTVTDAKSRTSYKVMDMYGKEEEHPVPVPLHKLDFDYMGGFIHPWFTELGGGHITRNPETQERAGIILTLIAHHKDLVSLVGSKESQLVNGTEVIKSLSRPEAFTERRVSLLREGALLEKQRVFTATTPCHRELPHELVIQTYLSTQNCLSLNEVLTTALKTPSSNQNLLNALNNLDVTYKILSIYLSLTFYEEYHHGVPLQTYLRYGLWDSQDFRNYINSYKDQTRDFILLALPRQAYLAAEELESYLKHKTEECRQQNAEGELIGYPLVDQTLQEIDASVKLFYPSSFQTDKLTFLFHKKDELETPPMESPKTIFTLLKHSRPENPFSPTLYTKLIIAMAKRESKEAFVEAAQRSYLEASKGEKNPQHSLRSYAKTYGFSCQNMPNDGNCFYHAVSHQLESQDFFLAKEASINHELLRTIVIDHIVSNWTIYASYSNKGPEVFVTDMGKLGGWGDEVELLALSRALNLNIVVIRSDNPIPHIYKRPTQISGSVIFPNPTIYLGYEVGFRYQSLISFNLFLSREKLQTTSSEKVDPVKCIPTTLARKVLEGWLRSTSSSTLLAGDVSSSFSLENKASSDGVSSKPEGKAQPVTDRTAISGFFGSMKNRMGKNDFASSPFQARSPVPTNPQSPADAKAQSLLTELYELVDEVYPVDNEAAAEQRSEYLAKLQPYKDRRATLTTADRGKLRKLQVELEEAQEGLTLEH